MKHRPLMLGLLCSLILASVVSSHPVGGPIARLPDSEFTEILPPIQEKETPNPVTWDTQVTPPVHKPPPVKQFTKSITVVVKSPKVSAHTVRGTASWYCSPAIPICMHGYPPGSMVAAACGKLRRAMGKNWRGTSVVVRGPHSSVRVVLVDWCGSKTKLIDLYQEPMSRLGGTGTLTVTVIW